MEGVASVKNQPFLNKLYNACAGIRFAWSEERNFRTHIILGSATLVLFSIVQPAAFWWALIILCITLILAAELINSAVEALIDHLHPEIHATVGKVKDMLAGMVLVLSLGAVSVAVLALYDTWLK
jgi:undecaprenol kinase